MASAGVVLINAQERSQDVSTTVAVPSVSDVPPPIVTTTSSAAGGGGFRIPVEFVSQLPWWAKLALGSALILGIPLYKKVFRLEGFVEKITKAVVKGVEEVAPVIEKIAEELADALPEGSFIEQKLEMVEAFAEEVNEQAHIIEAFLHKVDDVKEEVEETAESVFGKDTREEKAYGEKKEQ